MIWTEDKYTIENGYINIHILLYIGTNRRTMIKLFHLSCECSIQNGSKYAAYAVTALRDEQITAVRLCCADKLISNGQQSINQTHYFGAVQSKQLSTNDSAILDAVMFICVERWSQIHGIR